MTALGIIGAVGWVLFAVAMGAIFFFDLPRKWQRQLEEAEGEERDC